MLTVLKPSGEKVDLVAKLSHEEARLLYRDVNVMIGKVLFKQKYNYWPEQPKLHYRFFNNDTDVDRQIDLEKLSDILNELKLLKKKLEFSLFVKSVA